MASDIDANETLEGRVRALEALLLSLPISDEQFASAKERLRSRAKAKSKFGELRERLAGPDGPLDAHGENALAELAYHHKKNQDSNS